MNTTDKKISETLGRFGEPMAGNTWKVQGTTVIYHKALERIAAKAHIEFKKPTIIRAERDEAVILVEGSIAAADAPGGATRHEWSIGEAVLSTESLPGNYRVSGKQAAYIWAMAEKRAKDRVILKLIELSGILYSEEEADEFKDSRPQPSSPVEVKRDGFGLPQIDTTSNRTLANALISTLQSAATPKDLAKWFSDNSGTIEGLPEAMKDEVRSAYAGRLHELKRAA